MTNTPISALTKQEPTSNAPRASFRPPEQARAIHALDDLLDELDDADGSVDEVEDDFLKRAVSRSGQHRIDLPPR